MKRLLDIAGALVGMAVSYTHLDVSKRQPQIRKREDLQNIAKQTIDP